MSPIAVPEDQIAARVPLFEQRVGHYFQNWDQLLKDWHVKVKGTISKVEWLNPHVWFYVDVKDDSGKITTWGFSNAPPGALMRRGITKDALKIGAEVTVEGVRAKDGSNNASGRRVIYADGTNAFTATENAK